ncbi:MAG: MFS transporter [Gammaproteobacteria bacterium]|nr:MFS transporter [Gammaproteobacteria bacterium]|tara:strand:+ start:1858 stop:3117 length:1260 start_codon:yes stop_codon:yes gene_type:complete
MKIGQNKITKSAWSWALYDWANSAFATTVMAGFGPLFFKSFWASDLEAASSTWVWGVTNSLVGLIIGFLAPILGAYSDIGRFRKKLLGFFVLLGVLSTGYLYFIQQGEWFLAVLFYSLAVIGFSGGNIFYDSLIVFVSEKKERHSVSSLGFSLGYLGGGLLFIINVLMYLNPSWFGFASQVDAILWSFLTVAFWWAIFSLPIFLHVNEGRNEIKNLRVHHLSIEAFRSVFSTLKEIKKYKRVAYFLAAYFLYIDGVDTIIRMATSYGSDIGLEMSSMITALIVTQFVGFPSTLLFGVFANRIGFKRILTLGIVVYIVICFYSAYMTSAAEFYFLAAVVGLVQGGVQAISRSFFSTLIPRNKTAEFFGFFNFIGKTSVIIGPFLVSSIALVLGNPRYGILSLLLLFIPGLILLWLIPEKD